MLRLDWVWLIAISYSATLPSATFAQAAIGERRQLATLQSEAPTDEATAAPTNDVGKDQTPTLPPVHARSDVDAPTRIRLPLSDIAPMTDLSAVLSALPGSAMLARQNEVQDTGLSARGIGARAAFGTRGVRIEFDGVPQSMPDGQGQLGLLTPQMLQSVDWLQGPYATIYGFNAGAVMRVQSEVDPSASQQRDHADARASFGLDGQGSREYLAQIAFGFARSEFASSEASDEHESASSEASDKRVSVPEQRLSDRQFPPAAEGTGTFWPIAALGGNVAAIRQDRKRARDYSDSQRQQLQASLHIPFTELRLRSFFALQQQGFAQDPGSLTRAELALNPSAANPLALALRAGKELAHAQLGLALESDQWQASAFHGQRDVQQTLILSPARQRDRPGVAGWIELERAFSGARLSWQPVALRLIDYQTWLEIEQQKDQRLGFENFSGTNLGQRGVLKRAENAHFRQLGFVHSAKVQFPNNTSLLAGWRWNQLRLKLLQPGSNNFPVRNQLARGTGYLGMRYEPHSTSPEYPQSDRSRQQISLGSMDLSVGQNYETPTLTELANRPDGAGGLNTALRPARLRQAELVWKIKHPRASARLTAYRLQVRDELIVVSNDQGRAVFGNAARTLRTGIEGSFAWQVHDQLHLQFESLWQRARYQDHSSSDLYRPVRELPSSPRQQHRLDLAWQAGQVKYAVRWHHRGAMLVDDRSQEKLASEQWLSLHLLTPLGTSKPRWWLSVSIDDLFQQARVAGLSVNDSNGRYFDPAPGRRVAIGISADW